MSIRVGLGYDAHQLVQGRRLILGGVEIPFDKGLMGHSDADVLCHAIADALLGAAALGDIGQHFPDSEPRFKDMCSLVLLEQVAGLLREENVDIVNVDATVIAQKPKLSPYIPHMVENISRRLRIPDSAVSVKATTTEGLGFEGEGAGIAAQAVALVYVQKEEDPES